MFHEQLLLRALAALCEIADECGERPAARSLSLRFLLAYTFAAAGADPKLKWIWNDYWEQATSPVDPERPLDDYIRGTGARSAFTGICREVGYPPDNVLFKGLRDHAKRRRPGRAEPPSFEAANDEGGGPESA